MDELTRLLSDLVSIPSVNPMGRGSDGPEFLETRLSAYLESWFRNEGISVTRQPIAPGRDNLLVRYNAPDARRTLLFDAHQDTVPTDGMTIPPFEPRIEGGKLFGRGSCDVKAGMTAMLLAFRRLYRERPKGSASVIMACTVDEEFTHMGSSRLAETQNRSTLRSWLNQLCSIWFTAIRDRCGGRFGPEGSPATVPPPPRRQCDLPHGAHR